MFKIVNRYASIYRGNRYQSDSKNDSTKELDKFAHISRVWYTPLPQSSNYINPCRLHYIQDRIVKSWDMVKVGDSAIAVLYNPLCQKLIMVRQFRPTLYHSIITGHSNVLPMGCVNLEKFPPSLGITLEFCQCLIKKPFNINESIKNRVLEECGYDIPKDHFESIFTYRSGINATSSKQILVYAEISDEQKVSEGGGQQHEAIEVLEYSLQDASELIRQGANTDSTPSLIVGLLWFFSKKAPKICEN